jgi:hypothetical protein
MTPSALREETATQTRQPVGLRWETWREWLLANLVAEALGLGATLLVGTLLLGGLESRIGLIPVVVLGVILGALSEGGIVGSLQWLVLRRPIPSIRWREWAIATVVGAGIAWVLGWLPSVVMSFVPAQSPQTVPDSTQGFDMALPVILLLAAAMGVALGAILGTAQWIALRKHTPKAGWWILANAVAWAIGMVLVFVGTSFIPDSGVVTPCIITAVVMSVALAGIAVGAIHGIALIWLIRERDRALLASHTIRSH